MDSEAKVINGSQYPLGRLSSVVAKLLIDGERVVVVNASNVVISGSKEMVLRERREKRGIGTPRMGPEHPKKPSGILRKSVRGMLPGKRKGKEMLSRLRVHDHVPDEYKDADFMEIRIKRSPQVRYVTLEDCNG